MRAILIPTAIVAALAVGGGNVEPAQAKGCIKGAIAGGLAGHMAGHSVLGAIGGCAVGRTLANRSARQQQQAAQKQNPPGGIPQGYGNQGYSTGAAAQAAPGGYGSSASLDQGYGTRTALPPPSGGTSYGGANAPALGNDGNLGSLYNGGAYHR